MKKPPAKVQRTGSRIFDAQDLREFRAALKARAAEPITREEAMRLLVKSGIYTRTGRLTKHYR